MVRTIRLIYVLTIAGIIYSCDSSNDSIGISDSREVSDSLNNIIINDAFHLTHKFLAVDTSYNNDIELPDEIFSAIYSGLMTLYQITNDPILDSILYLDPIHCNPSPTPTRLQLYTDNTIDWPGTWYRDSSITVTNNPILDALISDIEAELFLAWPYLEGYEIWISFPDFWNLHALKKAFLEIDGIWATEFNCFVARSLVETNIEIRMETDGIYFTFIRESGSTVYEGEPFFYSREIYISNETGSYVFIN